MSIFRKLILIIGGLMVSDNLTAQAAPEIGKPAPNFATKDINGKDVQINDLKGKIVVLEWSNFGCPFVKKHYDSKNMQDLQKAYKDKVVWITIFSSAPGKEGHMATPAEAIKEVQSHGLQSSHVILDPQGTIGKSYEAKTTPHMFVIDPKGNIAYMGAIDNDTSADKNKAKSAKNYVVAAINALSSGKEVEEKVTPPYGCSVKY